MDLDLGSLQLIRSSHLHASCDAPTLTTDMRIHSTKLLLAVALSAAAFVASPASAQMRFVNYNTARLIGDTAAFQAVLLAAADDNSRGFAVDPAIITFQEVPSSILTQLTGLVNAAYAPTLYTRATYTEATGESSAGGAPCMFYRTDLLTEDVSKHIDLSTGGSRYTDRWYLKLNGYTSLAAGFYVYSSHLKASNTAADEATRLAGVITIRNNSDTLPVGSHILYCGDFNFYTNAEDGFIEYTSAGVGKAIDPYGLSDWTGAANALRHTQSPILTSTNGLVAGGCDDRFDFQLSNLDFQDGDGIALIANTYRPLGNDANHYNLGLNSPANSYFGAGQSVRSQALANALVLASDHIPLIADYAIPPKLQLTGPSSYGRVLQNATIPLAYAVSNIAPVQFAQGMFANTAAMSYGGTGLTGGVASVSVPLAPSSTNASVNVNSAVVGATSGTVGAASNAEGGQAATSITVTGTVIRRANASFASKSDLNAKTIDGSVAFGPNTIDFDIPVSNFGFNSLQALLDVDSVSGLSAGFTGVITAIPNIAGAAGTVRIRFDATGKAPGLYTANATVHASDENLVGAQSSTIALTLRATVNASANPADLNGDGEVNGADLAILLNAWGTTGPGDIDQSGIVDAADIALLLGAWGV